MSTLPAPLAGVRVLELGSTIAGPSAGRLLADLGAEVIKVEQPEGDQLRTWGELAPDGTSWWFKSHNRNKQLLMFDLRKPEDIATVRQIALQCDVVLENFRPGWLEERGLGPRSLREQKPELIYVSISGYGQTGPYATRPGYGNIAEAMGGLRYITGEPDGPPMRVGISIGDELAGLYAVVGALAALHARSRDGRGDTIDISLIESTFSLLQATLPEYVHCGKINRRTGNRYLRAAPNSVYPTKDGEWLAIGGNSQSIFRRLATLIGKPELADDPRFATNQARAANAPELDRIIAEWTRGRDMRTANDALADAGVPAGPVMSIAAIAADPQFQARGAITSVPDDDGTPIATYGPIPRFSEHPSRLERAAGRIGRDQEVVLHELGIAAPAASAARREVSARAAAPTGGATPEKEAPW
jgi:crotonobetainyl-CoA:carnitine CoA-transferase CaiB-like acyl-CoA transferase